jgi:hypothetical protein
VQRTRGGQYIGFWILEKMHMEWRETVHYPTCTPFRSLDDFDVMSSHHEDRLRVAWIGQAIFFEIYLHFIFVDE